MKYTKHFSVTVLVLLALLLTTVTFAYWAGTINFKTNSPEQTIKIGTADTVEAEITLSSTGTKGVLVPEGFAVAGTSAEKLDIDLALAYKPNHVKGAIFDLALNGVTATVGTSDDVSHLFEVKLITKTVTLESTKTVTMKEPANKAEYDRVATKDVKLNLSFAVVDSKTP